METENAHGCGQGLKTSEAFSRIGSKGYCLSNDPLIFFPIVFVVTRAIGGKHGRLSEMHASTHSQGWQGLGQPALGMSGLWLSVYALHAAWETLVATVTGRLSLLSRRLDERLGDELGLQA